MGTSNRLTKKTMIYFQREIFTVEEEKIVLTSWLDISGNFWRALAPHYLNVVHDWRGVKGETREQALDELKMRLRKLLDPEVACGMEGEQAGTGAEGKMVERTHV